MKVALGADHRGYQAKERIKQLLVERGHEVLDFGTDAPRSCDYPDMAFPASKAVVDGKAQLGVLICGTGIGMCIASNKVPGVRAALCHDELTCEMARRHNDANVLCLPADLIGEALMKRIVDVWLRTSFEGGRHEGRLEKIREIEQKVRQGI